MNRQIRWSDVRISEKLSDMFLLLMLPGLKGHWY